MENEQKRVKEVHLEPLKVLIAEDSQADVELMIRTLKLNYIPNFKHLMTSEEYLNAVSNENWDVILADYHMPEFSAHEALNILHSVKKDIPFIIVSGTIGEEAAVELLKAGAHDFISKSNLSRLPSAIGREIKSAKDRVEKKLSDEALRQSEKIFREIFENASDGLLLVDVETLHFSFSNSTICKMLGYEPSEFRNLSVPDIHPAESLPYILSQLDKQKRKEISLVRDIPVKRKNGTIFYADINSFDIIYEGRKCLMGIFRDITDRKLAEDALKKSERFLSNIFQSIQDGVTVIDLDMKILQVNPTMEKWYAHAMPLVGKKCYEAYHGRDKVCEICPTITTLDNGKAAYEVVPKRTIDGKIIGWLDLYSFPLKDTADDKMNGVIEYVRDVTEKKKVEEKLNKNE